MDLPGLDYAQATPQSYLRALQRKIDDEKAKLNNPQPQATPGAKPTAQPTKKPK